MKKPKILITGATGKTGSSAAFELLKRGFPVRALAHRVDTRSRKLHDAGAEVVVGKLEDPTELSMAMNGVQRAYFVCPWTENQLDIALNFAIAAADHRIEHIVAMSQWLSSPTHPSTATRRTYLTDRVFDWLPDTTRTLINVGFFADNYMALLEPISQLGMMPMPLGEGLNAPVSNEDIGRTVAGSLAAPELHAGKIYRPTGPNVMRPQEIADSFGQVLGRKVKYQNISPRMFLKASKAMRMPLGLISQLDLYFGEYRSGAFGAGAPNDAVLHVTGCEPEPLETIIARYVKKTRITGLVPAASQQADTRRTLGNKVRAIKNFAGLLMTPTPNLSRYARELNYPIIAKTHNALESPAWKESHDQPGAYGSTPKRQMCT